MNNYNELINKPTINGKELIGDVEVSGLPEVTSADAGKVPIVGEDGSWTVGTVSGGGGFNASSITRNTSTATITKVEEV